ncbi:MAG: hypothetical protein WCG75_02215 [Armatimonadota bacterium]
MSLRFAQSSRRLKILALDGDMEAKIETLLGPIHPHPLVRDNRRLVKKIVHPILREVLLPKTPAVREIVRLNLREVPLPKILVARKIVLPNHDSPRHHKILVVREIDPQSHANLPKILVERKIVHPNLVNLPKTAD